MATGRENIITFNGGFPGRTADAIPRHVSRKYREMGKPEKCAGSIQAECGTSIQCARLPMKPLAASARPIQSMAWWGGGGGGGVEDGESSFLSRVVRELCDERGIILIYD